MVLVLRWCDCVFVKGGVLLLLGVVRRVLVLFGWCCWGRCGLCVVMLVILL